MSPHVSKNAYRRRRRGYATAPTTANAPTIASIATASIAISCTRLSEVSSLIIAALSLAPGALGGSGAAEGSECCCCIGITAGSAVRAGSGAAGTACSAGACLAGACLAGGAGGGTGIVFSEMGGGMGVGAALGSAMGVAVADAGAGAWFA